MLRRIIQTFVHIVYESKKHALLYYHVGVYLVQGKHFYSLIFSSIADKTVRAASGILVPGPKTAATPLSYKN